VKIIAVVGTGSGCGKTTVACRILRAFPGLGAVKISPREGVSRVEWGAGEPGKDTALYLRSGAFRVARIIGPRERLGVAWDSISEAFQLCPGVVIEGAGALEFPGERLVIFVIGDSSEASRESQHRKLSSVADVVIERSAHQGYAAERESSRMKPSSDVELADTVKAFLGGCPKQ